MQKEIIKKACVIKTVKCDCKQIYNWVTRVYGAFKIVTRIKSQVDVTKQGHVIR